MSHSPLSLGGDITTLTMREAVRYSKPTTKLGEERYRFHCGRYVIDATLNWALVEAVMIAAPRVRVHMREPVLRWDRLLTDGQKV